ncbi:MAG: hypothetical protein DCC49_01155 [Acidobacteria bacterium]|nr:MAG: hypothetical protein DCC49_01155 [Acidobacteriota bacterium]
MRGLTVCWKHGGASPASLAKRQRFLDEQAASKAVKAYGGRRDIDPAEALLEEVHRTAGHVSWLEHQIAVGSAALTEVTPGGTKTSVWVELYNTERNRLIAVTKAALDAGIAERQVQLAEAQGLMLASVIRAILDDLELSAIQRDKAPDVIRQHLLAASAVRTSADKSADIAPPATIVASFDE